MNIAPRQLKQSLSIVVAALTAPLGLALIDAPASAAPLPPPTLRYVAAEDTDGDDMWENTGTTSGFDWTMGSPQSPVTGIDDDATTITAAYQFPAAVATASNYSGFQTGDATFEMWFRPGNLTGEHVLHENGGGASAAITLDEDVLRFGARTSGSAEMSTSVMLGPNAVSRFNHVVGVLQIGGGAGQIDLYLNGSLVDTDTIGSGFTLWTGVDTVGLGAPGGSGLFAGDTLMDAAPTDYDGQIAIYNFYATALDGDQILEAFLEISPVPEPSTFLLVGIGLVFTGRRRAGRRSAVGCMQCTRNESMACCTHPTQLNCGWLAAWNHQARLQK